MSSLPPLAARHDAIAGSEIASSVSATTKAMATTHLIQISPNCRESSPAPHKAFTWRLEGGRRTSSFELQANPLGTDDEMGVVDDYHSGNHVDRNREEHEEVTESGCQGCHRIRVDEESRQKLSFPELGAIHGAAFPNATVDTPHCELQHFHFLCGIALSPDCRQLQ